MYPEKQPVPALTTTTFSIIFFKTQSTIMKLRNLFIAALVALVSFFGASTADAQVSATIRIGQPAYGSGYGNGYGNSYGRRQMRPVRRHYMAPRPVVVYRQPVRRRYVRPVRRPQQVVIIQQPVRPRNNYGYGYRR